MKKKTSKPHVYLTTQNQSGLIYRNYNNCNFLKENNNLDKRIKN